MEDLTSILQEERLTEAQLKAYLEGSLEGEALARVEKIIHDSPFMADAVEGLKSLPSTKNLQKVVQSLNENLHLQLVLSKDKRHKRKIPHLYWAIIAIVLILVLCFLAFWVINTYFR